MAKLILSVDAGKYMSKCVGIRKDSEDEVKEFKIRSKFYDLKQGDIELGENSYKIEIEDQKYIIGEQGTTEDLTTTNKATLLHKLSIYTLISKYLKSQDDKDNEVYMVLSCPLNLLSSIELKEEYKNYISNNNKKIKIIVNDKEYTFTIKEIMIKSEGSGAFYLNKEKFKNKDYLLIDIGGLNMQTCMYRNGVAQVQERFTEMTGSKKLVRDIKKALEIYSKGKSVTIHDAEKALKEKIYLKDEKTKNIIKNVIKEYISRDAITTIQENLGIDINTVTPLFIGGTMLNIKDEIEEIFGSRAEIQDDAQMASVKGLFKIALAKYNR